jgi:hypothetical protein
LVCKGHQKRDILGIVLPRVHQNYFSVFDCGYTYHAFTDRHAIAGICALAVNFNGSGGWHHIGMAVCADGIFKALAGLNPRAKHAGIGADGQGITVLIKSAR